MKLLGYFTSQGEALSAKLLMGTSLKITRVAAGDGESPTDSAALTHTCQALPVGTMQRSGTTVTLPVTLTAAAAAADYTLREIGVYALDPEEGEILYRIYRLSDPVEITAGGQLTIRFSLQETVSEAADVVVSGASAGLLTVADRGVPAGVAALDESGLVPPSQLPYSWGTEDLEDGVSALAPGKLYFVCSAGTLPGGTLTDPDGTISFTVGSTACSAADGMTWSEWISSAYYAAVSSLQLQVNSANGYVTHPAGWVRDEMGGNIYGSDILQSDAVYSLSSADEVV